MSIGLIPGISDKTESPIGDTKVEEIEGNMATISTPKRERKKNYESLRCKYPTTNHQHLPGGHIGFAWPTHSDT